MVLRLEEILYSDGDIVIAGFKVIPVNGLIGSFVPIDLKHCCAIAINGLVSGNLVNQIFIRASDRLFANFNIFSIAQLKLKMKRVHKNQNKLKYQISVCIKTSVNLASTNKMCTSSYQIAKYYEKDHRPMKVIK